MPWFEAFGWLGSGLVVASLMLSNLRRFRTLNLTGSVIATIYNAVLGIWPFVAMNGAIVLINGYWLIRLHRDRFVSRRYAVLRARVEDDVIQHTLAEHAEEIATLFPGVDLSGDRADSTDREAFLVVTGDVTAGLVVLRRTRPDSAVVELDFVTKAYRDYTPGEFVYRHSGVIPGLGLREVVVPRAGVDEKYFRAVGFVLDGDDLTLDLAGG